MRQYRCQAHLQVSEKLRRRGRYVRDFTCPAFLAAMTSLADTNFHVCKRVQRIGCTSRVGSFYQSTRVTSANHEAWLCRHRLNKRSQGRNISFGMSAPILDTVGPLVMRP